MFDIGFSEIVVIAVVALIVIGPERLPKAARTLGHLLGRLQRYVNDVKSDITREMELDELRKLQQEVQTAASDIQNTMSSAAQDFESGVRAVENDLNRAGEPESSPTPAAESAFEMPPELTEPPSETATQAPSASSEPSRQASLPGFDRI